MSKFSIKARRRVMLALAACLACVSAVGCGSCAGDDGNDAPHPNAPHGKRQVTFRGTSENPALQILFEDAGAEETGTP